MTPELLTQAGEFIVVMISFIIFVLLMKRFAWGPVTQLLEERQRRIEAGFEEIKAKQAKAEELEEQLAARLRDIEHEARARIQEAVADGRRVAAELTEQARAEASEITERAKRNIELEVAKARIELRDEVVALTLGASERLLRQNLDDAGQRRLVSQFLDELGNGGSRS